LSEKENLDFLRQQMAKVIHDNPAPKMNREDREIALFEDELRESGLNFRVEMAFSELDSSLESVVFNTEHGFAGRDYLLIWDKQLASAKAYHLLVQNQKTSGCRRLLECPDSMKNQLLGFLHTFAVKISSKLGDQT
tara:strand:- start:43000 stop:43407 length:408 start_codon:yes stop_codon:yes gene_type:complete